MRGQGVEGALRSAIRLAMLPGLALYVAQPAGATIVTATITGTVDGNGASFSEVPGGIDTTGVFGTAGASLIGDPFKLVYTINDTKGQQGTLTDANGAPYYSYIQSRTTFFPQYNQVFNINPITSAVLTLTTATGQHPYTFGTFQGSAPFPNPVGNGYVSRDTQQKLATFSLEDDDNNLNTFRSSEVNAFVYFTNPPITPSYKWNSPLSYTLNPSSVNPYGQAGGDFEIFSSTNGTPLEIAGGGLLPTSLVVSIGKGSPPTLAEIISGSVHPYTIQKGTRIVASFNPNFGLTLADVDSIGGFSGLDWVQLVTKDPYPPTDGNGNKVTVPYLDPPPSGYLGVPDVGQFPFVYPFGIANEQNTLVNGLVDTPVWTNNALNFSDRPYTPMLLQGDQYVSFATSLVGVCLSASQPGCVLLGSNIYVDYLSTIFWNDNYSGGGTGGVGCCVVRDVNGSVPDDGFGGVTIEAVTYPLSAAAVPEPSTTLSVGLGFITLIVLASRKNYNKMVSSV